MMKKIYKTLELSQDEFDLIHKSLVIVYEMINDDIDHDELEKNEMKKSFRKLLINIMS